MKIVPYFSVFVISFLLLAIGLLLIVVSGLLGGGYDIVAFMRDAGLILGPLGFVGVLSEAFLRREFTERLEDYLPDPLTPKLVFADNQQETVDRLLRGASKSVVWVGNETLYPYFFKQEQLVSYLSKLKSAEIFCLRPDSAHKKNRSDQIAGGYDFAKFSSFNEEICDTLKRCVEGVSVIKYDFALSEYFLIVDEKTIFSKWYPFGKGNDGSCPYILVEDATATFEGQALLAHYKASCDFLRSSV